MLLPFLLPPLVLQKEAFCQECRHDPSVFFRKKPFVKSVDTTPLFSLLIGSLFQFVVV